MSSQDTQAFLAALFSLPRTQNPYVYAANFLKASITPAISPRWLTNVLIFFAVVYLVHVLLGLTAIYYLIKSGRLWILRSERGIWIPNTRLLFTPLALAFSACMLADLIWQVCIDLGDASFRGKPVLQSMRFVPYFWSGVVFGWGIIAQILLSKTSGATFRFLGADGSVRRRRMFHTLNAMFVIIPILNLVSAGSLVIWSDQLLSRISDTVLGVIVALEEKAPTYNPDTYNAFGDIIPLLAPLKRVSGYMDVFSKVFRAEWIVWCFWSVLFVVAIVPFVRQHLRILRQLMGQPSLQATFFSKQSPCARSSNNSSLMAMTPVLGADHERHCDEFRRLARVAFFVILHAILYTPLGIWLVCLKPYALLQSLTFWEAQAIWSPAAYAIGGIVQQLNTILAMREITNSDIENEVGSFGLLPIETFVRLQDRSRCRQETKEQESYEKNAVAED